jgi:CRISPR-associated exonuclease Cas4
MPYSEDDFLMLSGIQHFAFCRRQWALIHIEQQWSENLLTAEGRILHERAHDEKLFERRGDVLITRGMRVSSKTLGLAGACDVVEFHADQSGIKLFGHRGVYLPVPVEYKRGRPKQTHEDALQLCAQAVCLEEMLVCTIPRGYLYYGETKHRQEVDFDEALRNELQAMAHEMHEMYRRQHTPKVKTGNQCRSCSLKRNLPAKAIQKRKRSRLYRADDRGSVMKKLLNTLYITNPEHYLALEGETVCVLKGNETAARLPLHNLQSIVTFGYTGASPALMGACAKRSIDLSFLTPNGKFSFAHLGESRGNVLLRKMQYRVSDNADECLPIAKNFVTGKIFNAKWIWERATRDHALRLDTDALKTASMLLSEKCRRCAHARIRKHCAGWKEAQPKIYFACFDDLILQQKEAFKFDEETGGRRQTTSMRFYRSPIRCWQAIARARWKRPALTHMLVFCIQTDRGALPWRSI